MSGHPRRPVRPRGGQGGRVTVLERSLSILFSVYETIKTKKEWMIMALHKKLSSLAAAATGRANNAIENGKLSLKINNEERKITEFTLDIGELVVDQLDAGSVFDDEIMALYSSIEGARAVIDEARADMEANRRARGLCVTCGAKLKKDALYCSQCGAKIEAEEPAVEEGPAAPVCPECGTELEENDRFCPHCGVKLAEDAPAEEAAEAAEPEAPAEAADEEAPAEPSCCCSAPAEEEPKE